MHASEWMHQNGEWLNCASIRVLNQPWGSAKALPMRTWLAFANKCRALGARVDIILGAREGEPVGALFHYRTIIEQRSLGERAP